MDVWKYHLREETCCFGPFFSAVLSNGKRKTAESSLKAMDHDCHLVATVRKGLYLNGWRVWYKAQNYENNVNTMTSTCWKRAAEAEHYWIRALLHISSGFLPWPQFITSSALVSFPPHMEILMSLFFNIVRAHYVLLFTSFLLFEKKPDRRILKPLILGKEYLCVLCITLWLILFFCRIVNGRSVNRGCGVIRAETHFVTILYVFIEITSLFCRQLSRPKT